MTTMPHSSRQNWPSVLNGLTALLHTYCTRFPAATPRKAQPVRGIIHCDTVAGRALNHPNTQPRFRPSRHRASPSPSPRWGRATKRERGTDCKGLTAGRATLPPREAGRGLQYAPNKILSFCALALLVLCASPAFALKSLSSSVAFTDAQGNPLANGYLTFQLSAPAKFIAGGQVVPIAPIKISLTAAGLVAANQQIAANDELQPTGTYYIVRVFNSNDGQVRGPENWILSGASPVDLGLEVNSQLPDPGLSNPVLQNPAGNQAINGFNLTAPNFNSVVYVDGTKYPLTGAGVQSAINAACNGTALAAVIIPPGTISLGTTGLTVPNNCDVGGTGASATKLTLASGAATTHFSNAAANPANIRIHDLTLDGSSGTSASEGCIGMNQVTAPTDITIERVTCQNVGATGFNVTGTAANPGTRVKFLSNKVINAGLVCPGSGCAGAGQIYGILASFNSHMAAIDNEISGGGVTLGIGAFSSINASSATPIVDVQYIGNRIHDLPYNSTPGAAMDIGRARQAVASGNVVYNVADGGCVFFEAIWGGSITGNACSVADAVVTGGPIVVKTPDSTQTGEVASQDISIAGNSIIDNSVAADTNSGITVNGAQRNISIKGNSISYLNQATSNANGIFLQLGTNDSNISGASQNFCNGIVVEGNTITNRPGTGSATLVGIYLLQNASGCVDDQIVISNNVVITANVGVKFGGTAASNGITHAYIHDNSVDTPTTGLVSDGKTYASVFAWNNNASGSILNLMPVQTFNRFKLADQGQCTMASGACTAQSLSSTYTNAPMCAVSWTGSGTLAGTLKVSSTTTTVTPASSTGTDTAIVNWMCFGS